MSEPFRVVGGPLVDRAAPVEFRFNGRSLRGLQGDTLASALLANGVHLVARSWKYHRPRGVMAAGVEEPNALVQLGEGAHTIPNARATEVELYEGLAARSVNCFPGPERDWMALAGLASGLLQTSMQVGGAVVLAVVTAVIDARGADHAISAGTLAAYRPALGVIAGVAVLGPPMGVEGLLWANAVANGIGTAWLMTAALAAKKKSAKSPRLPETDTFLKPT